MARDRPSQPPRVGVNDEDAFVGDPIARPPGLDPFDGRHEDGSGERDAALELLPKMTRVTSTHDLVSPPRASAALVVVAVLLGVALMGLGVYVLLAR